MFPNFLHFLIFFPWICITFIGKVLKLLFKKISPVRVTKTEDLGSNRPVSLSTVDICPSPRHLCDFVSTNVHVGAIPNSCYFTRLPWLSHEWAVTKHLEKGIIAVVFLKKLDFLKTIKVKPSYLLVYPNTQGHHAAKCKAEIQDSQHVLKSYSWCLSHTHTHTFDMTRGKWRGGFQRHHTHEQKSPLAFSSLAFLTSVL